MDIRRAPLPHAGHAGSAGTAWRLPHHLFAPQAGLAWVLLLQVAVACLLWHWAWQSALHWRNALTADSGIDEQRVLVVAPLGKLPSRSQAIPDVLASLAGVEGVQRVARVNQAPYGRNSWNTVIRAGLAEPVSVSTTFGDAALFATLGVRLQEGRLLQAADYQAPTTLWQQPGELPVVVTRALAERLFPGQHALGRIVHGPTRRLRIVGVIAGLPTPVGSRELGVATDSTLILPAIPDESDYTHFLVRVQAGREAHTATAIQQMLARRYADRPIALPPRLADLRPATLQSERRCVWTLALCALAWSLLTLLSLAAAAMLWVQRNGQRISLHRALGASRAQVRGGVHWNLLRLVLAGCLAGSLAGLLAARWLAPHLPALAWVLQPPTPAFALSVLAVAAALSQLIALWPARRAATIAPHHVTRKPWVRL
jgi:putative ABC transport system permease protein